MTFSSGNYCYFGTNSTTTRCPTESRCTTLYAPYTHTHAISDITSL